MKHEKSFPVDETGRIEKHNALATHIGSVASVVGLSPTDVTSIEDDNKNLHWICNAHNE